MPVALFPNQIGLSPIYLEIFRWACRLDIWQLPNHYFPRVSLTIILLNFRFSYFKTNDTDFKLPDQLTVSLLFSTVRGDFFLRLTFNWFTKNHGLRTPGEEISFIAWPKINYDSQNFRYGWSIFRLPHQPKFSGFFDLCLHWVSVVCV